MSSKGRMRRPSPTMIVAGAALVVALGGTAIATPIAVKSVLSKPEKTQVKKISKNQANSAIDTRASGLSVLRAATAANAELLDSADSTDFHRYESTIPSGTTIQGAYGYQDVNDGTGSVGAFTSETISFPVPAPDPLADAEVGFTPAVAAIAANDDEDAACTGTTDNPTAPAGKVCVYPTATTGLAADSADATQLSGTTVGTGSRFGFSVDSTGAVAGAAANFHGVWAYTAP